MIKYHIRLVDLPGGKDFRFTGFFTNILIAIQTIARIDNSIPGQQYVIETEPITADECRDILNSNIGSGDFIRNSKA